VEMEKGSWVVPGVLGGIGVAGIGVGLVFSGLASSAKSDGTALGAPRCGSPAACPEVQDAVDTTSSRSVAGIVATVAGGAFVGAAVVSALVLRPWEERTRRTVQLVPGFGGAAIVGKF
jgi:hypothetical protein